MIRFDAPQWLLLALPWLLVWWSFARAQHRACRWIADRVAERHRTRLTVLGPRSLRWLMGLLLVLGLLLVAAAARPTRAGGTVREITGRVVLVIDASASMRATDVAISGASEDQRQDRFELARALGRELVERLDGYRFALVSFSGAAATQLPMTSDRTLHEEALRVVEVHNFYRHTGSSFGAALDRILSFVEEGRGDLQAVLLSDGEPPFEESFDEPLAALAAQEVPVHTVAVGSLEGQTREIYDFRDIAAKAKKPAVLREYATRRVDEHLAHIARATGGRFEVAEGGDVGSLAASLARTLRQRQEESESVHDEGRGDLSVLLLAMVLIGLVAEALVPWQPPSKPTRFELQRLGARRRSSLSSAARLMPFLLAGTSLAAVSMAIAACAGDDPAALASIENGKGIEADRFLLHREARTHYERSLAYDVWPEIPTYNLARSVFLQHDYSEAHELYQRALEIAPDHPDIHYNDGHALYRWGVQERDPQGCFLLRTLELWKAARQRFATAQELYEEIYGPESTGSQRSQKNVEFMDERIDTISALLAQPPPECREPPSGQPLGSNQAGGGEAQGLAEGAPQGGEPQEDSEPPQPETQDARGPRPGGSPEESPEEGQEGGSQSGRRVPGPGSEGAEGSSGRGDPRPETGPAPLNPEERAQIAEALERLREQGHEGAKYHRRTRAEQFPAESWKNPEREIWW